MLSNCPCFILMIFIFSLYAFAPTQNLQLWRGGRVIITKNILSMVFIKDIYVKMVVGFSNLSPKILQCFPTIF